jgi:hypothetical protein
MAMRIISIQKERLPETLFLTIILLLFTYPRR